MKFNTIEVDVNDLLLDPFNPRFIIPPTSDQEDIIKYLLEYEEVIELAKSINSFGGFMPGDRVIVCIEDGKVFVLEGNRRVCACKLLLDRSLIPEKYSRFPVVLSDTKESIQKISVDLVPSRELAQSTLYKRHIEGVKKWSTISKQKFFANEFNNGKDIEYIADISASSIKDVKKGIRGYNLTLLALGLDKWTKEEKEMLDLQDIKVDPFLRVFTTKSEKYNISALTLLKMSYDEITLEPVSEFEKEVFEDCIFLIARAAFFNKEFNTRNKIDEVPGLLEYLGENGLLPTKPNENADDNDSNNTSGNADSGTTTPPETTGQKDGENGNKDSNPEGNEGARDGSATGETNNNTSGNNGTGGKNGTNQSPKVPAFFHALTWHSLNATNSAHFGLILLADEIKKLSVYNHYGNYYPVSTAILLRSLFEQSLKYYTKFIGEWDNLILFSKKKPGYDPMLGTIINFYKHNDNYKNFFSERAIQSAFSISTEQSMLDFFDTIVHNTHIVKPTKTELENKAAHGLFSLIQYILNNT